VNSNVSSGSKSAPSSAVGPRRRRVLSANALDAASQDEVAAMITNLKASDFRERSNGIERLRDMASNSPHVINANITAVSMIVLRFIITTFFSFFAEFCSNFCAFPFTVDAGDDVLAKFFIIFVCKWKFKYVRVIKINWSCVKMWPIYIYV
jgi:hypothetical protein